MTQTHMPDLTKCPNEIDEIMRPETNRILRENVARINIGEEFFKHLDLFQAVTYTEKDWFYLADAKVKLVPYKGVKSAHITGLNKLVTSFMILYKKELITDANVIYDLKEKTTSVINIQEIIIAINSSICKFCLEPVRTCTCRGIRTNTNFLTQEEIAMMNISNLKVAENVEITASGDILKVDKVEDQPVVDVSKFQPLLMSLVKTMRVKSVKQFENAAHEIIKKNPAIAEAELARELLRLQF